MDPSRLDSVRSALLCDHHVGLQQKQREALDNIAGGRGRRQRGAVSGRMVPQLVSPDCCREDRFGALQVPL